MLVFEIEFLAGVSVSSSPYHREVVEWPPHPDRLFQALVAAWGRNDPKDDAERDALEWLENLDPSLMNISAPQGRHRDVVTVFVPPNDVETKGKVTDKAPAALSTTVRVIPDLRKNRQPRSFPAVTLPGTKDDRLHYGWHMGVGQTLDFTTHKPALSRLAREVTYIGHSRSLVRVTVVDAMPETANMDWMEGPRATLRMPYPGRFQELLNVYARSLTSGQVIRPRPSLAVRTFATERPSMMSTLFDAQNVTILADAGGTAPTLAAFPLVAKRMRDALLHCVPSDLTIPALLSGHEQDGTPALSPHLAIVPLADVGWSYSSGRLMGLGLVWPRDVATEDRRCVLRSLADFLQHDAGNSGLLHFGRSGSWKLALAPDSHLASLRPGRYVRTARRWGTVLPILLDRHPKDKPGSSLIEIIVRSCLNVGIPSEAMDGLEVEIHGSSSFDVELTDLDQFG